MNPAALQAHRDTLTALDLVNYTVERALEELTELKWNDTEVVECMEWLQMLLDNPNLPCKDNPVDVMLDARQGLRPDSQSRACQVVVSGKDGAKSIPFGAFWTAPAK